MARSRVSKPYDDRLRRLERVVEAARELLKAGEHEGACTNASDPEDACDRHIAAYNERKAAMIAALSALDEGTHGG